MGLFSGIKSVVGGFTGSDAGKAASKASKNLMNALQAAQAYETPAYDQALASIDPTYAAIMNYLGQGKTATLGAYQGGYDTARSDLANALQAARGDITGGYNTARGDITGGYNTARGDVANSLAAILASTGQAGKAALGYYQPYMTAGETGLGRATAMTTPGDTSFQADPGYAFRLAQGTNTIQNSAAGRGGVLGGNTLKALNNYGQNLASQEFGNVYNRNLGLAQLGLGASQGAAGIQQWMGNQNNAANQWAGNQNTNLAQWMGNQNANLAQQYGTQGAGLNQWAGGLNANLATNLGANQAGVLNNYYTNLGNLTQQQNQQRQALALARANMLAGYAGQAGDVSANREIAQGNAAAQGSQNILGLLGNLGGAALGVYGGGGLGSIATGIGGLINKGVSGLLGSGTTNTPAAGYGLGAGYNNPNIWLVPGAGNPNNYYGGI